MTKRAMAEEISRYVDNCTERERAAIVAYQMRRSSADVRESLGRQRAIAATTRHEIVRNCQPWQLRYK